MTYEPPKATVHVTLAVTGTTPPPTTHTPAGRPRITIEMGDWPALVEITGDRADVAAQLRAALALVEPEAEASEPKPCRCLLIGAAMCPRHGLLATEQVAL